MYRIDSKEKLHECLKLDSLNYASQNIVWYKRFWMNLFSTPGSDQKYIWKYIYTLRHVEYHLNIKGAYHKVLLIYYLHRLRNLAYKTGFQIPPNVLGPGVTIWHWGPIIINQTAHIGSNTTLYPGVLVGWKNSESTAPIIGDNCFLGAGCKIIGNVNISDDVKIAQNVVLVKNANQGDVFVTHEPRILNK